MSIRIASFLKWVFSVGLPATCALLMILLPLQASSAWPDKPVHIVVPFAPGGAPDLTARALAPALQKLWGQPVVIENRSGAGATIGTAAVANAAGDGYTLLLGSAANAIDSVIQKSCLMCLSATSCPCCWWPRCRV